MKARRFASGLFLCRGAGQIATPGPDEQPCALNAVIATAGILLHRQVGPGGRPAEQDSQLVGAGEVVVAAAGVGEDAIVDGVPVGELGEVVADFRGVRAEVVGSVGVDEDAGAVGVVVAVTECPR